MDYEDTLQTIKWSPAEEHPPCPFCGSPCARRTTYGPAGPSQTPISLNFLCALSLAKHPTDNLWYITNNCTDAFKAVLKKHQEENP